MKLNPPCRRFVHIADSPFEVVLGLPSESHASLLVLIVLGTTITRRVRVLIEYIPESFFLSSYRTFVQAV